MIKENQTALSTRTLKLVGIFGLLIPVVFVSIFPLLVMISTSFKTSQEVYIPPPTFLPRRRCRIMSIFGKSCRWALTFGIVC